MPRLRSRFTKTPSRRKNVSGRNPASDPAKIIEFPRGRADAVATARFVATIDDLETAVTRALHFIGGPPIVREGGETNILYPLPSPGMLENDEGLYPADIFDRLTADAFAEFMHAVQSNPEAVKRLPPDRLDAARWCAGVGQLLRHEYGRRGSRTIRPVDKSL